MAMYTDVPLMSGAYSGISKNFNAQACENLVAVFDKEENVPYFYSRPGLDPIAQVTANNEVRNFAEMGGKLWMVAGAKLYSMTTAGVINYELPLIGASTGMAGMAVGANDKLLVVDGVAGYTVVAGVAQIIHDYDFQLGYTCCYIDGYYIVSKKDSGEFYISELDDPTSWNALSYASAEGSPDNLQAVVNNQNNLWLFGNKSIEIWFDSGNATFPFERITGAISHVGTLSPRSIAVHDRAVYFLDNELTVRASRGLDPQRISTSQIEYNISQYTNPYDANGYMMAFEGNVFYILTFKTDNETWVYNIVTGLWSKWTTGVSLNRFSGNCFANFNGVPIVGDKSNGYIYTASSDVYMDNEVANSIRRYVATRAVHDGGHYLRHHGFRIDMETGNGEIQVAIGYTDDAFKTQHYIAVDIDDEDYSGIVAARRLGRSKNRVYYIMTTSNAKIAFRGIAHANISRTNVL